MTLTNPPGSTLDRRPGRPGSSDAVPAVPPPGAGGGAVFRVAPDDEMWFRPRRGQPRPTLSTACWWDLPAASPIDPLVRAVRLVASRHDILTGRIEHRGDEVHWRSGVAMPEVRDATTGAASGFPVPPELDPASGPMLRVLLDQTRDHTRFCLQISHAVLDAWALDLLLEEIAAAYDALCEGGPVDTSPGPGMEEWAAGQWRVLAATRDQRLARWQALLDSVQFVPAAPPRTGTDRRGALSWRAPEGLPERVCGAARRLRCSPTILLAGLLATCYLAVNGEPTAIRLPFVNRHRPGAENVIGNLSTQVPLLVAPVDTRIRRGPVDLAALGEFGRLANRRMHAAADLLPMSFEAVLDELWAPAAAARADCQAPFFALHIEDGEEYELAGVPMAEMRSPADEQDGCEITAEFDDAEAVVNARWRGLTRLEEHRLGSVFDLYIRLLTELWGR